MKILVTGATGFIGSNLVHHLTTLRPSWKIVSLDSLTYAGNYANISDLCDKGKTAFVQVDIRNSKEIAQLFEKEK